MKTTVVFTAKRTGLEKARDLLKVHEIACHISSPRHEEGILRVAVADANRARTILTSEESGRIVSDTDAAWFQCYDCGANLSGGEFYCPKCKAVVGDPHGR